MSSSPIRYFLYARKSSESEDKQVASIPSQIDELERMAKERNLKIVKSFTEEKSAKAPGRPVFNDMLDAIQQGKANGIICWKLDRLGRTASGLTKLFDELRSRDIGFAPLTEGIDLSTAAGKMTASILASVAEFEREVRAERQMALSPASSVRGGDRSQVSHGN